MNNVQNYIKNYPGNNVVSFCVWGDSMLYYYGLWENAMLMPEIFPGWKMLVYYTKSNNIIEELEKLDYVKTIHKDFPDQGQNAMLRFLPSFSQEYNVCLSRDADSRLLQRDAVAVYHWLNSNKNFHIMRDHPKNRSLIMAGMWGVRNNILCKKKFLKRFWKAFRNLKCNKWSNDQLYLSKNIYPKIKDTAMVHSTFWKNEPFATDFPKKCPKRKKGFIGQTYHSIPFSKKHFNLPDDFIIRKKRCL